MRDEAEEDEVYTAEHQEQPKRRRTFWIWVILAFTLLDAFSRISSWWGSYYKSMDLPFPMPEFGVDAKFLSTIIAVLNLAAAWNLFMLKSRAVKLYAIALVGYIIYRAYLILAVPNYVEFIRALGLVAAALGFGVVVQMICLIYAANLRRKGVLM